jgi:opacity protein-like surface antigen
MIRFFAVCIVLAISAASPARAAIIDPLLRFPTFPNCESTGVLNGIASRFNWMQKKTFESHVRIEALHKPHSGWASDGEDAAIPRLHCSATVELNNGHHSTVYYLIEGGVGFAGNGAHVAFCVLGYDPYRAYNGSCRTLRP